MKRLFGAALLTGLTIASAHADNRWQGNLFITANTAQCGTQTGTAVGDWVTAVFRPRALPGNGTSDLIAMFYRRAAFQIFPTAPTSGVLNAATAGTYRYIFGSAGFGQYPNRQIINASVSPAAPTTTTPTVDISITVKSLFNVANCDVTFVGTLAKRP